MKNEKMGKTLQIHILGLVRLYTKTNVNSSKELSYLQIWMEKTNVNVILESHIKLPFPMEMQHFEAHKKILAHIKILASELLLKKVCDSPIMYEHNTP